MSTKEDLKAIMNQGKSTAAPKKEDQKFTGQELLKKYFNPRVADGEKQTKFKVRVIPNPKGGTPFHEVKFHQAKLGTSYKKFLCLDEVEKNCPFCDTHAAFLAENNKEEAKPFRAHKHYIVRIIERGKEHEGIKFWRFKENWQKAGEMDKIQAIIDSEFDILSTDAEGYDLHISCSLNDKNKSSVASILCVKPSALAETQEEIDVLINDDATWIDVYGPKPAEYLEEVIAGKAQYWDASLKKYVRPGQDSSSSEDTPRGESPKLKDNPLMKDEKVEETNIVSDDNGDEDDLPF